MFAKILLFIKSMSLAAKVTVIAATVVVVGGTTTAVVIVSQNHGEPTPSHQDEIAQNDQPTETGEQPKEDEKPEDDSENKEEVGQNNNQSPTSQPQPEQPSPEPEPEPIPEAPKSCSDLQNCDYNLNDRYVFATSTFSFFALSEGVTDVCAAAGADPDMYDYIVANFPIVETRTFYYVDRFVEGTYGLALEDCLPVHSYSLMDQVKQYASSKGLGWMWNDRGARLGYGCPGYKGCAFDWTWQKIIDDGYALDEAKCATWGLSCGRW